MNSLTVGDYKDETEAAAAFDLFANSYLHLWSIHKEVKGVFASAMPGVRETSPRIDRILLPTKVFVDAGWKLGAIGVEIKKSNQKVGKVISQCIDYRNAVFQLRSGFDVSCRQVFIWPLACIGGDIESIMAQYRVGAVSKIGDAEFSFWLGQQRTLVLRDGSIKEFKRTHAESIGKKRGSR